MNNHFDAHSNNSKKLLPPEALSQRGAMALAKRLERFWHRQGYPAARFWAEPIDERFDKIGTYELYRVESNLVNGLPPRCLDSSLTRSPLNGSYRDKREVKLSRGMIACA